MLPDIHDPRWKNLISSATEIKLQSMPAALMLSRLKRSYKSDNSHEAVEGYLTEIFGFFTKYEKILGPDIANIFN